MVKEVVFPITEDGNDPSDIRDDEDATAILQGMVKKAVDEARAAERANRFNFTPVSDLLKQMRGTQWLIKPILETNSLVNIFGDSGTFKSFVAIDLLCCIASGKPYHGRKVGQGPVVMLVGEGKGGITKRIAVWRTKNKYFGELPMIISNLPAELMSGGMSGVAAVSDAISEDCQRLYGQEPVAICIDTLSANLGDGDESSNGDMGKVIREIGIHLRERFQVEQAVKKCTFSVNLGVSKMPVHPYTLHPLKGGV